MTDLLPDPRRSENPLGVRARAILSSLSAARAGRPVVALTNPAPADAADRSSQMAESSPTVVPLPKRAFQKQRIPTTEPIVVIPPARPGAKRRRSAARISALLSIGLPTALATLYYGFIAAPQYVAEARFAIRGPADVGGGARSTSVLSALTGMGGASDVSSDSFIVAQFIQSGQLTAKLQRSLNLRGIYASDRADFLTKYRPNGSADSIEHLTRYWNGVSSVYYDALTGIISFSVRAFTPEDALRVARETVRESESLVNRLSERARDDSLLLAKQEQSRAEMRLKISRKAMQDYRNQQGSADVKTAVEAQTKIVADLEGQLAKAEAELGASAGFLSKDAPTVRVQRNTIDSLKTRVAAERAKIGTMVTADKGAAAPLSAFIAQYENLQTDIDFAEKAYEAASTSVENARITAERQSRYLTTFVDPYLPEDSLYPARLKMILMVLVASSIAWAIGALVFYGIRDHSA